MVAENANKSRQPTPGVALAACGALLTRRGCAGRYMRVTTALFALALMLVTACSTGHTPATSNVQMGVPHRRPPPAGDFVLGTSSHPDVKLRINADGTYFAEQRPAIEFWPMIEGNKVYPQRTKPEVEKGHWAWNRTTGALTLAPETAPNRWWPIDSLQFDPRRPDCLVAGGGGVLKRVEK